jgi:hypothetical protein
MSDKRPLPQPFGPRDAMIDAAVCICIPLLLGVVSVGLVALLV